MLSTCCPCAILFALLGEEIDCATNLMFTSAGAKEKDRITGEKIWKKFRASFLCVVFVRAV